MKHAKNKFSDTNITESAILNSAVTLVVRALESGCGCYATIADDVFFTVCEENTATRTLYYEASRAYQKKYEYAIKLYGMSYRTPVEKIDEEVYILKEMYTDNIVHELCTILSLFKKVNGVNNFIDYLKTGNANEIVRLYLEDDPGTKKLIKTLESID